MPPSQKRQPPVMALAALCSTLLLVVLLGFVAPAEAFVRYVL